MNRACLLAAIALALVATPARARAAADGDGAYGRLKGDLTFVGGLGAGVVAATGRPVLASDLRLRYLDAAGVALGFEEGDALARTSRSGELRRAFLAGVELRPLFPVRFLKAQETGRRFLDLVLDSIALDLGTWWPIRYGSGARRPGMYTGLAVEAPLSGGGSGLWLRLSAQLRWAAPRLEGDLDPSGRSVMLGVGLAWHQVFGPHLVQRGDEPLE
ncbi:MAG: hypothetical protein HYV09_32865 [Deltaproteobacteria bacterium]|nr:hypothetical protein [Deltaproteobacteria bacterium]